MVKNGLHLLVHHLRLLPAVSIQEIAACIRLVLRAVNIAVPQGQLQVRGNLAAPLGQGFLLGHLDGRLDGVDRFGVGFRDNGADAVLRFAAVDAVRLPAVQEGKAARNHDLLGIGKATHLLHTSVISGCELP